ncbi:phosphatase PAP2 family protein [Spirosoma radiotolerans]|uniref:Phosphoesterase PA-phosphatase n=1 Tax=Spirosoma radiotolerans TaxID=1379870 RepID=A0A0E3ZWI3_9BACT|nr:phosphatase PAP2 family protein [Spirosoma radiotolerans]AKD55750.1 phosphoesterase PA-phosphatase [Spirosoma radiotolerans]
MKYSPKLVTESTLVLILSSFFFVHASFAQTPSPYELKTGREIALLGAGAAIQGGLFALNSTIDPLTPAEVSVLNRADINSFDRKATYQWSTSAARLSDVTLAGNAAVFGLLALGTKPMRQDIKTVGIMFVETIAFANGFERVVKAVTQRPRPFVYNPTVPLEEKLTRDARQSFFSGHATHAFATAVFTGEVFRHYFPNSRLKPVVWIGSLGLATATCLLRYEAGVHYPTDLIAGAAVGSLVGWGIPKLHQVKNQSSLGRRMDIQPWSTGSANGIYMRLAVFSR